MLSTSALSSLCLEENSQTTAGRVLVSCINRPLEPMSTKVITLRAKSDDSHINVGLLSI